MLAEYAKDYSIIAIRFLAAQINCKAINNRRGWSFQIDEIDREASQTVLLSGFGVDPRLADCIRFLPPNVASFRGAQTTDKEVEVRCLALECNETIKGIVLNLLDTEGAEVRAFCPKGSFDEEPSAGSIIDIVCQPSMDDRTFFISSIEVVH